MEHISLNGKWTLRRAGGTKVLPATVPGCVHTDLIAAGEIDNPFYRDNELRVQWIEECEWRYTRTFSLPRRLLEHDRVLLRCQGLDTLATVLVNGHTLGATDNMFRAWEFDVKSVLTPGRNEVEIRFASVLPHIRERMAKRFLYSGRIKEFEVVSQGYVRKMQCNFGWDWAPRLVTCGIWQPVEIVAFNDARLSNVWVRQLHRDGGVRLTVGVAVESVSEEPLSATVTVSYRGRSVASARLADPRPHGSVELTIKHPELWWPRGLGSQPLYEVTVSLSDGWGRTLDSSRKRIGLRTLRLARRKDRWGESFQFEVNGVAFFAKGANWVPAHAFPTAVGNDTYRDLLQGAADAHMNMLRVWGGGFYENDLFYDLCDELGICVWQDFMFACCHVPLFDQRFVDNVCAEAEEQVQRLRHHACIALWCGNNEFEQDGVGPEGDPDRMQWDQYEPLFDRRLAAIVATHAPRTDYWPCSPHSPLGPREDYNNATCGDAHLWYVWGYDKPIHDYLACYHRFVSEFGFQSFPAPRTIEAFTRPADRRLDSRVMQLHQRSGSGNEKIMRHAREWFRVPKSFENGVWLGQILQALAIQTGVEHWRRNRPRCMGAIYWMLNDCWPVVSWSSVDFHGRWKALHYAARRFFAPLVVSGRFDAAKGAAEVFVCNDTRAAVKGRLTWTLSDAAGVALARGGAPVAASANAATRVRRVTLTKDMLAQGGVMLWLELSVAGKVIARNLILLTKPKRLALVDPAVSASVRALDDDRYRVSLKARAAALWIWLSAEGVDLRCEDNFFHLRPGRTVTITVTASRALDEEEFVKRLRVRSLVDTYA